MGGKGKDSKQLSEDDISIWKKVARTVTPNQRRKEIFENLLGGLTAPSKDKGPYIRVQPNRKAMRCVSLPPLEPSMDKKMRKGRVQIDRKIDLHDKTRIEAEEILSQAIRNAYINGQRHLLVVTGKGPRLNGVLRGLFPDWINSSELRPMISAYSQAHLRHGGTGAWYVFIKRKKN